MGSFSEAEQKRQRDARRLSEGAKHARPADDIAGSGLGVYKKQFLQSGLDQSTKRLDAFAKSNQQSSIFGGGTDGGFGLNQNKEAQRAVTSKRAQTRDYRLARREAIRRNDRLGAARIGQEASGQGFNLHGIGKFGEDYQAAQRDLHGAEIGSASRYQSALGGLGNTGQGATQGAATGGSTATGAQGSVDGDPPPEYKPLGMNFDSSYFDSPNTPKDTTFEGGHDTSNPVRGIDDAPYSPAYQQILDDTSGYRTALAEHGNSASIPKFGDSKEYTEFQDKSEFEGNKTRQRVEGEEFMKLDAENATIAYEKAAKAKRAATLAALQPEIDASAGGIEASIAKANAEMANRSKNTSNKPKPTFKELNGGKSPREVRIAKENEGLTDRQIEDKDLAKKAKDKAFVEEGTPASGLTASEWWDATKSPYKAAWKAANELREITSQPASKLADKNKKEGAARQALRDEIKKMESSGASRKVIKEAKDKLKQQVVK